MMFMRQEVRSGAGNVVKCLVAAGVITGVTLSATASLRGTGEIAQSGSAVGIEYQLIATSKTSTMEKELNQAAEAGFRFDAVMGGETAFGGNEVVAAASRAAGTKSGRFGYKLLATSKTSTMQMELQGAADEGFHYRGQTVFKSAFGGEEVVCILERDGGAPTASVEYRLVATSKTGTLQKELALVGASGYQLVGMTVGKTALGGNELVAITRRVREQ
jgi:hypothetical protein